MVDLDREQDIEELRRIAHAQQTQIRILLEAVERQQSQIAALKGTKGDPQLTLKMLEALQAKAKAAQDALAAAEATAAWLMSARTARAHWIERVELRHKLTSSLDAPERTGDGFCIQRINMPVAHAHRVSCDSAVMFSS